VSGDLNRFLLSQIWQVPSLLIFIFGLVLSLSGRWRGPFVNFAAAGFAVLLFGLVVSAYHQFAMSARIAEGDNSVAPTYGGAVDRKRQAGADAALMSCRKRRAGPSAAARA